MATETPRDLDWRVARVGREITISRAEPGVGNAVLSPEDEDEGCYWTLIGAGPDEQQNALAEIIARALNSSGAQSQRDRGATARPVALSATDEPPPPLQSDFDRLKEELSKSERFRDAGWTSAQNWHARAEAAEARAAQAEAQLAGLLPSDSPARDAAWDAGYEQGYADALLQKLKAGVSPYVGEREGEGRQTINDPHCADEGTQEPSLAPGASVSGVSHAPDCQSHIVDVRGVPDDCTCGVSGGLLPCPHCGAPAEHDSARWDGIALGSDHCGHAIYCSGDCPLPASGGTPLFETREEAAAWWNRREPSGRTAAQSFAGGEP